MMGRSCGYRAGAVSWGDPFLSVADDGLVRASGRAMGGPPRAA